MARTTVANVRDIRPLYEPLFTLVDQGQDHIDEFCSRFRWTKVRTTLVTVKDVSPSLLLVHEAGLFHCMEDRAAMITSWWILDHCVLSTTLLNEGQDHRGGSRGIVLPDLPCLMDQGSLQEMTLVMDLKSS